MKRIFIITALLITCGFSAYGQCTDGSVCVSQTTIDRAAKAIDELAVARDVIAKFTLERTATTAEREAAERVVLRLNSVIAVQDRLNTEYERVIALYKSVVEMQAQLIERLEKMLNKPKSAWQKLVAVLEKITFILAGAALGRGI